MFLPKTHTYNTNTCNYCVVCKWCHKRHFKKDAFLIKEGPVDRYFCDANCSLKWAKYRHVIGVSHIVKMGPDQRRAALGDKTIDKYLSEFYGI